MPAIAQRPMPSKALMQGNEMRLAPEMHYSDGAASRREMTGPAADGPDQRRRMR